MNEELVEILIVDEMAAYQTKLVFCKKKTYT